MLYLYRSETSFGSVKEKMVLQRVRLREASATEVTAEGPGAGVDEGVRPEVTRRAERLGAHPTFVRLVLEQMKRT
jgi:hypothetical protein